MSMMGIGVAIILILSYHFASHTINEYRILLNVEPTITGGLMIVGTSILM